MDNDIPSNDEIENNNFTQDIVYNTNTVERVADITLHSSSSRSSISSAVVISSNIIDEKIKDEIVFINEIQQYFNSSELSDVTINVFSTTDNTEGKTLISTWKAHRFILSKSSVVFKTMLYGCDWMEGSSGELELHEPFECSGDVFSIFLKNLYTGEAFVNIDSALPLLRLSDKYQVESLKNLIVSYMMKKAESPNVQNALTWLPWARLLNLHELSVVCSTTFSWNVQMVMDEPVWREVDLDVLVDILSGNNLVVDNEMKVYKGVSKWLGNDRLEKAVNLLPLVRFSQMHVQHLQEVEKSNLFIIPETKVLLHNLLSEAYRYRTLCPAGVLFEGNKYLSRNYLELSVDLVRVHNSLRFGLAVDVRTWRGPVPSEDRSLEWKITYRKSADRAKGENCWTWMVHILAHDEVSAELSLIMQDENERVLQVQTETTTKFSRGQSTTLHTILSKETQTLSLLIKPAAPYD